MSFCGRLSLRMSASHSCKATAPSMPVRGRARTLVEEMSLLGSRLRSKSNEDRRFDAVEALEAGLEARRKASLLTAKEGSVPASAPIRQVDSGDLQ